MPMASDTASQLQPLWWWMVDGHCSGLGLDWHRSSDPQLGQDMVEAEGEKLIRDRHDAVPGPGPANTCVMSSICASHSHSHTEPTCVRNGLNGF